MQQSTYTADFIMTFNYSDDVSFTAHKEKGQCYGGA